MTALIVILVLAVLVGFWVISAYNRLVSERLKVHTQWNQIDVVLKQRSDLIPNLVETVKGYAAHENAAIAAVNDARASYMNAGQNADRQIAASAELSGALGRLMAVSEAYPDLKANQGFIDLQKQVGALEEKLAEKAGSAGIVICAHRGGVGACSDGARARLCALSLRCRNGHGVGNGALFLWARLDIRSGL